MARGRMTGGRFRGEQLQHRQGKAGRLAGTGLRRREQVAPGENDGDRLRLDRRRLGVALLGDRFEQLGRKPEILE
jgi:hypothetical protein